MFTVYCYRKCSTCRDALKWLDLHGIPFQSREIRETPPSPAELAAALDAFGGDLRKLFNTSSQDYRDLGLKDRLPQLPPAEAFELMQRNGNLVKRPFVIGDGCFLVGFRQPEWEQTLKRNG